jgi:membrane-associated phospholipid phosphatase
MMSGLRAHLRSLGPTWTHWTALPLVLWPFYVVFIRGEVRWEFLALMVVVPSLAFIGPRTRKLYVGLYPFGIVATVYDSMRFVKNAGITADRIHVCDLRAHELALFGIGSGVDRVTLQDYFLVHHSNFWDLYCAIPYGTFIYVAVLFAVFLYMKSFIALQRYGWTFLVMNILAFLTYHIYPAAPPWYYHLTHSCVADLSTHASEGTHLANVDQLIGFRYFWSFYGRSSDVFGAVPSLHVAYPLLILIEGWVLFGPIGRSLAILFAMSMCFAAIYLDHHYVIDVLLGLTYAITVYLTFRALFARLARAKTTQTSVGTTLTAPATGA